MISATKENKMLGKISSVGALYLLPSNSLKTIVQYRPHWMISCVLPPDTKKVKLVEHGSHYDPDDYDDDDDEDRDRAFREVETRIPSTLFTHVFHVGTYNRFDFSGHDFRLNAIDLSVEDKLWITQYGFSNVAESGGICFGDSGHPTNLRAANILFWESPFNFDHSDFFEEHRKICAETKHEYYEDHCPDCCEEERAHVCKCKKKHNHRHVQTIYNGSCECCTRTCSCLINHKRGCLCGSGKCECICSTENCIHCAKDCECSCSCECCEGRCGCQCGCDKDEEHSSYVKDYAATLEKQKWLNGANLYCGQGFIATPTKADAVFMSFNKEFLDTVPQNLWRKAPNGNPLVVGFANKCRDDTDQWELVIGKHVCKVSVKQLTLV